MKKTVVFAVVLTLLTGVALIAYFMPEIMPEGMKSFSLNAKTALICIGVLAGSFWLLVLSLYSREKPKIA